MKADRSLDCVGLFCPIPIVKANLELEKMSPGEVLELLADDPGAENDFEAWCKSTGNEFVSIEKSGDVSKIYIRKK